MALAVLSITTIKPIEHGSSNNGRDSGRNSRETHNLLQGGDVRLFDFGLFLTVTVIAFSGIGLACIGLGSYAMLRENLRKQRIENNSISLKRP